MREPIKQDTLDLKLRQTYIGTSEWAVVAGLFSKYKTPYQVWDEKVNGYTPIDNIRMRLGRDIEPMIAKWVEEDMNVHVARDGMVRFHPEFDFLATNLDGIIYHKDGTDASVFEIKTASTIARETWGAELPIQYYTQIQGQMLITGMKKAYVAILTFGYAGPEKFEIQSYDYNPDFISALLPKLVAFWQDHVATGIPPAPVNNDDVKSLHPESNGTGITANQDLLEKIETLKEVKQTRANAEKLVKEIEVDIKSIMGDAEWITDEEDNKLVTWKSGVGRISFDSKSFKSDNPELYESYTKVSGPIRTFRIK